MSSVSDAKTIPGSSTTAPSSSGSFHSSGKTDAISTLSDGSPDHPVTSDCKVRTATSATIKAGPAPSPTTAPATAAETRLARRSSTRSATGPASPDRSGEPPSHRCTARAKPVTTITAKPMATADR